MLFNVTFMYIRLQTWNVTSRDPSLVYINACCSQFGCSNTINQSWNISYICQKRCSKVLLIPRLGSCLINYMMDCSHLQEKALIWWPCMLWFTVLFPPKIPQGLLSNTENIYMHFWNKVCFAVYDYDEVTDNSTYNFSSFNYYGSFQNSSSFCNVLRNIYCYWSLQLSLYN